MKAITIFSVALTVVLLGACAVSPTNESAKMLESVEPAVVAPAVAVVPNSSATLGVKGNCEKCKHRIEKAAMIDGVASVEWSLETQILSISFDSYITNMELVSKAIAAAGHDNEMLKADDEVYKSLPASCQYER